MLYSNITPGLLVFSADTFCKDPGQVPHTTRSNNYQGPFEHETGITYECDIGYHGGGYVKCQRNGEWTLSWGNE